MSANPREIGVLMSAPMCAAIRDGRKTQTRRKMNPQPWEGWSPLAIEWYEPTIVCNGEERPGKEIYGAYNEDWGIASPWAPGDRLRFLSSWAVQKKYDAVKPLDLPHRVRMWTHFDGDKPAWAGKTRPGRFMPLALRQQLPSAIATEIRVQRLHEISVDDARAEGFPLPEGVAANITVNQLDGTVRRDKGRVWDMEPIAGFRRIWEAINGEDSWAANVWVWAVSFRVEVKA